MHSVRHRQLNGWFCVRVCCVGMAWRRAIAHFRQYGWSNKQIEWEVSNDFYLLFLHLGQVDFPFRNPLKWRRRTKKKKKNGMSMYISIIINSLAFSGRNRRRRSHWMTMTPNRLFSAIYTTIFSPFVNFANKFVVCFLLDCKTGDAFALASVADEYIFIRNPIK